MWRARAWLSDSGKRLGAAKNKNKNVRVGLNAKTTKKNAQTEFLVTKAPSTVLCSQSSSLAFACF